MAGWLAGWLADVALLVAAVQDVQWGQGGVAVGVAVTQLVLVLLLEELLLLVGLQGVRRRGAGTAGIQVPVRDGPKS